VSPEKLLKLQKAAIAVISAGMFIYHLMATQYPFLPFDLHKNTHLAFALLLVFLASFGKGMRMSLISGFLILVSLASTVYIYIFYDHLIIHQGTPTTIDIIVGILLLIVVVEGTRRSFGYILPALCLAFIGYAFLGQYLPGILNTPSSSVADIVSKLVLTFKGIYGEILTVSVNYIFLFIMFGALMKATKSTRFFQQVGNLAGKRLRGGPAISAVLSSLLFGSVTGTASANVALTGSFTIPLMKRCGYTPEQAGAIEASASTIGMITPPVMGAAAFLMAFFTQVPYLKLVVVCMLPAVLTYLCVGIYAQLNAMKLNIQPPIQDVNYKELFAFAPLFFVPLITIIGFLVLGYSPMYTIFWGIIALLIISQARRETRLSFSEWVETISEGAVLGSKVGIMCAAIGIIVSILLMTGLGIKLPAMIEQLCGGNLLIALLFTMAICIFLGCGMPSSAAYAVVAAMAAPVIIQMGIPMLEAHIFVFYYAVFSMITPPVAPAAATASVIARGNFFKTAFESCKACVGALIIPYLIIVYPVLILQPKSLVSGVAGLVMTLLSILCLEIFLIGQYMTICKWVERLLALISLGMFALHWIYANYLMLLFGVVCFAGLTILQVKKRLAIHSVGS